MGSKLLCYKKYYIVPGSIVFVSRISQSNNKPGSVLHFHSHASAIIQ